MGPYGVFCHQYNEYIHNEKTAAKDCEMYDEIGIYTTEAVIIGLKDRKARN